MCKLKLVWQMLVVHFKQAIHVYEATFVTGDKAIRLSVHEKHMLHLHSTIRWETYYLSIWKWFVECILWYFMRSTHRQSIMLPCHQQQKLSCVWFALVMTSVPPVLLGFNVVIVTSNNVTCIATVEFTSSIFTMSLRCLSDFFILDCVLIRIKTVTAHSTYVSTTHTHVQ